METEKITEHTYVDAYDEITKKYISLLGDTLRNLEAQKIKKKSVPHIVLFPIEECKEDDGAPIITLAGGKKYKSYVLQATIHDGE